MPIQYDPNTGEITFQGQPAGKVEIERGIATVSINLTYQCDAEDWVIPISWFAHELAKLPAYSGRKNVGVTLESSEEDIEERYSTPQFLIEKTIKRDGYIWRFHKSDPDTWPSPLHGHDYEKGVKLDAVTGLVYVIATKQKHSKIKRRALAEIQRELRGSSDLRLWFKSISTRNEACPNSTWLLARCRMGIGDAG